MLRPLIKISREAREQIIDEGYREMLQESSLYKDVGERILGSLFECLTVYPDFRANLRWAGIFSGTTRDLYSRDVFDVCAQVAQPWSD